MTDVSSNDSGARYFVAKRPGDDDYEGESWAREVTAEVAAMRAQLAEAQEQNRMLTARCDELAGERDRAIDSYDRAVDEAVGFKRERDAMRPVVEAVVRRRIAWLTDDDDAENIAADRAEDAAVDAYRAEQDGVTIPRILANGKHVCTCGLQWSRKDECPNEGHHHLQPAEQDSGTVDR